MEKIVVKNRAFTILSTTDQLMGAMDWGRNESSQLEVARPVEGST